MKFHQTFTILPVLATLHSTQAYDTQSEELLCTGTCAKAIDLAIANNGGEAASIKQISKKQRGQGRGGKIRKYILTTKLGSNRIFSTINNDNFAEADDDQLTFDSDSDLTPSQNGRWGSKFKLNVINNYGCWCYGGASWPGARDTTGWGPSMDEYDEACKAHHMGFDCISLDADAENESCDPSTQQYSLLMTPLANGDYTLECSDAIEESWCKKRTCMVDLRFLARHWKLESDNVDPDYTSFGHSGFHNNAGNFDTSVCEIKGNGSGSNGGKPIQKVCCGDYPYRIWYDKNNSKKLGCCAYEDQSVSEEYGYSVQIGQLYNTFTGTCCSTGVITGSNICP